MANRVTIFDASVQGGEPSPAAPMDLEREPREAGVLRDLGEMGTP